MDKRALVAQRVRNALNSLRAELRPSGINLDDVEVRDTSTGVEVVVGSIKAPEVSPQRKGGSEKNSQIKRKALSKIFDEPDDPPVEDEGADE